MSLNVDVTLGDCRPVQSKSKSKEENKKGGKRNFGNPAVTQAIKRVQKNQQERNDSRSLFQAMVYGM
jgi:hypothetical protein